MTFDQEQRYAVVAALAEEMGHELRSPVLDVGGFFRDADSQPSLPVRQALNGRRTVTVDVQSCAGPIPQAFGSYVRADARNLPFPPDSFDLVSCLDVLEHVPGDQRPAIVSELLRVARGYVLVAVPVADDGAADREAVLAAYVRDLVGGEQEQIAEHQRFGLPRDDDIRHLLPADTRTFGYGNADAWLLVMLARYAMVAVPHGQRAIDALDAGYAAQAGAVDRASPFYRRFYLARTRPGLPAGPLDRVAGRFGPSPLPGAAPRADAAARWDAGLLAWILSVFVRADPDRRAVERAPLEQKVAHLEQVLRGVETSTVYRLYQWEQRLRGRGSEE